MDILKLYKLINTNVVLKKIPGNYCIKWILNL